MFVILVESIFRVGYAANPILLSCNWLLANWPLFCTTKLELLMMQQLLWKLQKKLNTTYGMLLNGNGEHGYDPL